MTLMRGSIAVAGKLCAACRTEARVSRVRVPGGIWRCLDCAQPCCRHLCTEKQGDGSAAQHKASRAVCWPCKRGHETTVR